GIMMRFLYGSVMTGVPGPYAIVHARLHPGIDLAKPGAVATDPPFPVYFHDPAQLPVTGRMKIMRHGTNWQRCPERLVSIRILAFSKLSIAKTPLQGGK